MKSNKKIPERMCVVCRTRMPKELLIRVTKNKNNEISVDKTFKAEGRGAYVCKNSECILKLAKTRRLNKHFKCEVPNEVYEKIKGELDTI